MARPLVSPQLAHDEQYLEPVKTLLVPLVKKIRTDRNTFRETLLRYYFLLACQRDQQSYGGRSNTFIGETRKIIDNWTTRICRDLFPTDNAWSVKSVRQAFEAKEGALKALFTYFFNKHTRLRRNAVPWVRQMVTLGTSPVKVVWRCDEREVEYLEDLLDEEGHPSGKLERKVDHVLSFIGPTFRTVSLFSWYVWPYTVIDVDDAEVVFEDILVNWQSIEGKAEKLIHPDDPEQGYLYVNTQKILDRFAAAGSARDKWDAEVRRLQTTKNFTHQLDMKLPLRLRPVDLTEISWVQDLEGTGKPQRYLVTLAADEIVLRIQRCPFWHNRAHWRVGKFVEFEDEFYGHGIPELIDKLNYTLIDTADQTIDALTWSMNPIACVDIFKVQDPTSLRMRPGAKWLCDVTGVKFIEPPKETALTGMNSLSAFRSLMHELADVVPVGGPQARQRGKSQQTSAGMQMAITEAQIDVKHVVENNEQVLVEFLEMTQSLAMQFLDRELVLEIAGAEGDALIEKPITVKDVVGDFNFEWLGSTQTQNAQVRAQQLLGFMGNAMKLPPELMASQNIEIDWKYLLREIYGTGLGFRDADRVIRDKVKQTSVDWRIENDLFRLDRANEVVVSEHDNHTEHAEGHYRMFDDETLDPEIAKAVVKHIRGHVAAQVAAQMMERQEQAQRQGMVNAGAPQRGGAAQPQPPGVATPAAGGVPRLPPPVGPGRVASTQGVDDLMRRLPRLGG